jgi:hypothetical protein
MTLQKELTHPNTYKEPQENINSRGKVDYVVKGGDWNSGEEISPIPEV